MQVLKEFLSLTVEQRRALHRIVASEEAGYRSWAGASVGGTRINLRTLRSLENKGLVHQWQMDSGTWRFAATKEGRDVGG